MSTFIDRLVRLAEANTRVRAVLRRSLAFDPGAYPPAFPYVESSLKDDCPPWQREVFYLIAGLWAVHWRSERTGEPQPLAVACSRYGADSGSGSVERRFIALLDADRDQLPHRLRQMIALLKDYSIDFSALLNDLLYWEDERRHTHNKWARQFYCARESQQLQELE